MYCKQCGTVISDQTNYCPKCGCYTLPQTNNTNNVKYSNFENVLIDKVKKCKIASLIGTVFPILINFLIIAVISIIFIAGPLNGDLDNLNYLSKHEFQEFAISYGLLYILTLPVNLSTLIVMMTKTKQLSDFQLGLQTNYSYEEVKTFFKKFNMKPVIIVTVISAVFLGVFIAIGQIIVCVILNNFKKFYMLSNSQKI